MKDFEEFRQFLLQDCRHEINEIGQSLLSTFSDDELSRISLSPEALGQLLKVVSWQTAQFVMLALERYHEWNETFSEHNLESPE